MANLRAKALRFAADAHEGQVHKYTGEPYIVHPVEVARILTHNETTASDETVAAAYLHDVVEDCDVSLREIYETFGPAVGLFVSELTEVPIEGNRKVRKAAEVERLSKVSKSAKAIKLADLISNTRSIVEHDPGFAKVYLAEKEQLLPVLREGSEALYQIASLQIVEAQWSLANG